MPLSINKNHKANSWSFDKNNMSALKYEKVFKFETDLSNSFIQKMMEKELTSLRERVKRLEEEKIECKSISDKEAEEKIKEYIIRQKNKGITKISILKIIGDIKLPPDQINRIMKKLSSIGVKEVD